MLKMEKIRHSVALLTSAVLLFSLAGCFGGKTGTSSRSKSSADSHTAGQNGSSIHETGESMDTSITPGSNATASGPTGNSGGSAAASTKPVGNNSSNVKPPLSAAGTAQVKAVNGIPRLFVEGKQEQPVFFMPPSYSFSGNKQLDGQMKLAAKNNVSIYVIPYETDYHELDDIFNNRLRGMVQSVHSYKPEAKVILRLGIDGALSKYGLTKSEAMELNGKATNNASLASQKWYGEAKTVLGNIVNNVKKDEFLNKYVIGYEYLGGDTGEWFGPGYWDGNMDTSESNRKGFEKYLKEKYKTDAAIRNAWGSGSVTLNGVRLPDHTKLPGIGNESMQIQNVNNGQILLTSKENQLYVDYLDYTGALRSEILAGFAETIKKACNNEKLAITYYGYHFDTPTASSSGFGVSRLLKSPHVDVLSGPLSYGDRSSGGVGAYMSFIDSVTAAGKMWFDEGDYRSPVHTTRPELEYPSSKELMDQVVVRQLAKCMVYNTGVWWLDLFGHGWFNYDSFWTTSKNTTALMAKYSAVKKQSTPEVCLILDESAMSLAGNARVLGANLLQSARTSLYTSGYRFGTYLIDDLISGKIDDAKVYVMLTPWRLSGSDAAALKSRLQRPGKVTLWMYGNGLTGAADFKALTGMTISSAKQSSGYVPQLELASGLATGIRNSAVPVNPVYYVEAAGGVHTLGTYNGGAAAGKAGFASYTKDGWTSVFYGGLTVSEDLLAYAAGLGKAHAFAPQGDVVYSDGQMVSMHVKTSGSKTFTFPSSCDIYNPQTKAWSAGKTVTINGAKRGQTILLFYGKKSELQAVAN